MSTRIVRRSKSQPAKQIEVEICVVGSGAAGYSAALEAARLGRKVALVDGLPALGGQAVNSIIGTFCGLFSNGTHGYQFTHGVADDIMRDLSAQDRAMYFRHGPLTTVVYYDEVALGRWVERAVEKAGIVPLVGAVLREVVMDGGRVKTLRFATRYGDVDVKTQGVVDASGDAAVAWTAGLPCHEPSNAPVFGTQMVILEDIDESCQPTKPEISARMKEVGDRYGLRRREGLGFVIPGRGVAAMNMTHIETPLDPVDASKAALDGKEQADRAFAFLKAEFPKAFGTSRIRAYGFPGIRQTRWIAGVYQLTAEDVMTGRTFDDAVARTAWPIELHDHASHHQWHTFPEDHVHTVPLRSLLSPEADNLVAAGRCMDADVSALSSVRVMGPCMAMGAAAANALDLAGSGSVHQIDLAAFKTRIRANIEGKSYAWTRDRGAIATKSF